MTDEIESNGEAVAEATAEEATTPATPQEAAPQSNARSPEACLQKIATAKREADEAQAAYAMANQCAKEAKQHWGAKLKALTRVIGDSTEELPLFDRPAAPAAPPDGEAWKLVPIGELGLPHATHGALADAGLATIGALANWTSAGKDLIDIKGIGESKADQIRDSLEKFWAEREAAKAKATASERAVIETDMEKILEAESDADAESAPTGYPAVPGEPVSTSERERVNPTKPKRTKRSSPKRKAASRR